jgi:hypothetical protein
VQVSAAKVVELARLRRNSDDPQEHKSSK